MQPLLDGPRGNLTEAQVRALLQSDRAIQITYGAWALDSRFAKVGELDNYITSGSEITSSVTDTIHRACTLNIEASATAALGWSYLSGYVKPYQIFTDVETGESATFNLGVYTLTTPTLPLGASPGVLQFAGYDLVYLLRLPIADSYEVAAGTDPAVAAAAVIGLAIPGVAVDVTGSTSVLTGQLTWAFDAANPVTYLEIIQTLLDAIGYRAVWVDWEGTFQVQPFVDLQQQPYEWHFDTADVNNIVAEDATQDVDLYDVPNYWRFVMANLTASPVEGVTMFTWYDGSASNPGSVPNRGRFQRKIVSVAAATYADLVNYAQRVIVDDLAPAEVFTVKTQPFPLAWHLDVIHYSDLNLGSALPAAAGPERRVVALAWKLPLDGQSDMEWTWQTLADQDAALGLSTTTT